MARSYRRRGARRGALGAGFPSRKRRPLEWRTPFGAGEVLAYPADQGQMLAVFPQQVAVGTPASIQQDIEYWKPILEGGIITLTRLVGSAGIWVRAPLLGNNWGVIRYGWQMVPWRSDALATPRLLFDSDDAESKEWLYRKTLRLQPGQYTITNGSSEAFVPLFDHFDIKTQRRYDCSLWAIVMSIAWTSPPFNELGDIFFNVSSRGLFRTGTGV